MPDIKTRGRVSAGLTVLAVLVLTASATAATGPGVVEVGGQLPPAFTFSPSVIPRALSRTQPSPIKLGLTSEFASTTGEPFPPALSQLELQLDRHLDLSTQGLPTCTPRIVTTSNPRDVAERCTPALVGSGTAELIFAFPESKALPLKVKVFLYNGGTRDAVTKLWIYIPIPVPTPRAIIAPVKVKKIDRGQYGTELNAAVPEVAEGYGLFERLSLNINREYVIKGECRSVATFRCAAGEFQAGGLATFLDGTQGVAPAAIRPCAVAH